jgi:hypothetical protein
MCDSTFAVLLIRMSNLREVIEGPDRFELFDRVVEASDEVNHRREALCGVAIKTERLGFTQS